mmetsp:Transcript_28796/g.37829  ORF Transcript_28796/g.37829 Transcript_28796/m.37829 type:complete len:296 (-) Transcript_28796:284-1171(-)
MRSRALQLGCKMAASGSKANNRMLGLLTQHGLGSSVMIQTNLNSNIRREMSQCFQKRSGLQDASPLFVLQKGQRYQDLSKIHTQILRKKATLTKAAEISSTSKYKSKSLLKRYIQLLEEHPYKTKMITSGIISGMGDVASQALTAGSLEAFTLAFSLERLVKYAGVGALVTAPILHHWYLFLGRHFPSTELPSVLQRLAMDQFAATPFLIVGFFGIFLCLDGKPQELQDKLKQDFWTTIRSNWMLWIPANLINFRFVPLNLQVLYSNSVGLFWNIYLSGAANRKVEHDPAEEKNN